MLNISSNASSYNDQGGAEAAVEVGAEGGSSSSTSGTGPGFGLFSTDFKK